MFNLEQAISKWRRQMLSAGITSPIVLDELESHLCDEIERQTKLGFNAKQAFENASAKIGPANALNREFKKDAVNKKKRIILMFAGVSGVAAGLAFFMPAIALCLHQSAMSVWDVSFLMFGLILTLCGATAATYGVRSA